MITKPTPGGADSAPTEPTPHRGVPWAGTLAALSLLWLVATLSSVRHSLGPAPEFDSFAVARAAVALAPVVSASLVAGVAVSLAVVTSLAGRVGWVRTWGTARYGLSVATGLLIGTCVAAPIALAYPALPSRLGLCLTVVAAAGVGGLLAATPRQEVVAAGVLGSLGVFLTGFAFGLFDGDLLALFGAGETEASLLAANAWVAFLSALITGLAAGLLPYAYLRRFGGAPRWPAFLAAGAAPGLLMLIAEALTRLGGAHLFQLLSAVSADETYVQYLGAARLNRTLIVLFVGAIVAIFLLGRSLPDTEESTDEGTEEGAAPSR